MSSSLLAPGSKVLVTGANGFVAVHVVKKLLQGGYAVRGTVRSATKGEHLKKVFVEYGDKLEIVVVEDITLVIHLSSPTLMELIIWMQPGAFNEALKGIDAIQHTASPATLNVNSPEGKLYTFRYCLFADHYPFFGQKWLIPLWKVHSES